VSNAGCESGWQPLLVQFVATNAVSVAPLQSKRSWSH
jgi:hypothetical protein